MKKTREMIPILNQMPDECLLMFLSGENHGGVFRGTAKEVWCEDHRLRVSHLKSRRGEEGGKGEEDGERT